MINIVKKFIYYFLTSGLFLALSLLILDLISSNLYLNNYVNFFAFASSSFILINIMQYNVVSENNKTAITGFLNHTLLGIFTFFILALTMIILNYYKYKKTEIISIVLSIFIFNYVIYFYLYYHGFLTFMN